MYKLSPSTSLVTKFPSVLRAMDPVCGSSTHFLKVTAELALSSQGSLVPNKPRVYISGPGDVHTTWTLGTAGG